VDDVRWNFEKFLLGFDGRPVFRYQPDTEPEKIAHDVNNLLNGGGKFGELKN